MLSSCRLLKEAVSAVQVKQVINFDFPKTVTDYLHRAGRTGRMGSAGQVMSLYSTKDAALAHKIEVSAAEKHGHSTTPQSRSLYSALV
jgi:superfamily II DNA/RNA helicase